LHNENYAEIEELCVTVIIDRHLQDMEDVCRRLEQVFVIVRPDVVPRVPAQRLASASNIESVVSRGCR